jgi:hypothetical protein
VTGLFRIGKRYLAAPITSGANQSVYEVTTDGGVARLPRSLFLQEITTPHDYPTSLEAVLSPEIMPLLRSGRLQEVCEGVQVVGLEMGRSPSLQLLDEGQSRQVPFREALGVYPQVGESLALRSHFQHLESLGLLGDMLERDIFVCMKRDPFRDATALYEGTIIELIGYYRGAAIIEADGEEFYLPLDEQVDHEVKDPDYYLTLDQDNDNVPDPLDHLPSKGALGLSSLDGSSNWNASTYLPFVAGHFAAVPEITNLETDVLQGIKESFGAISQFYYDYQHHYPELHGLGGPVSPIQAIADELLKGAPVSALFGTSTSI